MKNNQDGFSVIEILIVLGIIMVISGASVFYLSGHQKAYKTDDQTLIVIDFLQEARQRSLTRAKTLTITAN
jgi:type II secretory pathway pseudopilin PulG